MLGAVCYMPSVERSMLYMLSSLRCYILRANVICYLMGAVCYMNTFHLCQVRFPPIWHALKEGAKFWVPAAIDDLLSPRPDLLASLRLYDEPLVRRFAMTNWGLERSLASFFFRLGETWLRFKESPRFIYFNNIRESNKVVCVGIPMTSDLNCFIFCFC